MNRLRAHKFKPNSDATSPSNNNNDNNNEKSNSNSSGGNGLLTKITKRYSTLSSKITRRTQSGRKSTSPQKVFTGSYDMTGANSEDHRLEIGAPVLISTTTLDTDRLDVSEARLRQIGGGIAGTSTLVKVITATTKDEAPPLPTTPPPTAQSSPQIPSSGSENEMFVDAMCTTPTANENEVETFELALQSLQSAEQQPDVVDFAYPLTEVETAGKSESKEEVVAIQLPAENTQMSNYIETPKPKQRTKQKLGSRQHSKSAQNLHRSEFKVFLQRAPSMELNISLTTADFEHCRDIPRIPELFGESKCSLAATNNENVDDDGDDADKENSSPSVIRIAPMVSKSAPNTPMNPEQKVSGYLAQQQHFKSVDSLDIHGKCKRRKSVVFNSTTSISTPQRGSKSSVLIDNSSVEDFDLKSVSCQSLNAQNLFLSIEELNEITRQINESEEFNQEIDLEYCMHRDNLKPSERRITLLKNKNARLINFNHNKEKLMKGWNGVKHWIDEERIKIKDAVHKQASLQRVGVGSKMNLHGNLSGGGGEDRSSPSVIRNSSRSQSREKTLEEVNKFTTSTMSIQQSAEMAASAANNAFAVSCSNIAETDQEVEDMESSFTQQQVGDGSPTAKRIRREGQNGFEELRRYIKQGGDFGKELIVILQERVESELLYSKSLSKMANKLNKACRELPGSIADAWRGVATEMESRSDIHRQLSASLTDEIVKPLKSIIEAHHKTRKSVESNVDKASRVLSEWRVSEAKAKKVSHTAARENEKLQDAMLDVRIQKSPSIALLHQGPNKMAAEKEMKSAEKDCAKLDNKRKKAEEAVKRADVEYYTLCVRAERARVDWEMAVLRGSSHLQNLENQRLCNMKNFVTNYGRLTTNMNPILDSLVERLQPQIEACNVQKDMQVVKNIRRISEGPSEQLLPDFYCEHTTLAMNRERRKHALIKLLQLVKTDLERERRSRNGLKGLSQSLNNQEHQNITDKLYHIRSMLTYLEGARFKLHSALLELDHKPRSSHPLAQHIQITRDRTGLQQSILKVPLWLKNNDKVQNTNNSADDSLQENEYDCISQANTSTNISCDEINKDVIIKQQFNRSKSNIETISNHTQICLITADKTKTLATDPYSDRGQADGGSNQHDSDFDEFSSQDEDDVQSSPTTNKPKSLIGNGIMSTPKKQIGYGSAGETLQQQQYYQNTAEIIENEVNTQSETTTPTTGGTTTPVIGTTATTIILSRCKALYSYTPKLYDELELNPGDIIEVHAKQEDGWWLGALRNQVGIFPATYVEEFA